jgi:hypothetical protein
VEPSVPIPNTEIKRYHPEDSAALGCVKVGCCQVFLWTPQFSNCGVFLLPWFRLAVIFKLSKRAVVAAISKSLGR